MKKVTEKTFLDDVKNHKLTIICDKKNTRHIRLKNPETNYYWFDITTWHGHLCISGDMGTYVFKRTEDMFCFFRMDKNDFNYNKNKTLQINSGYWHEKLVSDSTFEPSKQFSTELFEEYLKEELESYCESNNLCKDFKKSCWNTIEYELLEPETEQDARESIENASWADYNDEEQSDFAEYLKDNIWEADFQDYTNHFIWCLYAIVWGINQYDLIEIESY